MHEDEDRFPPVRKPAQDEAGRFLPGNAGGPGRPKGGGGKLAEFRAALRDAVTPEDVAAVVAKLKDIALAGDVQAARLVLEYTAGKPRSVEDEADEGPLYKVYIGIDESKV